MDYIRLRFEVKRKRISDLEYDVITFIRSRGPIISVIELTNSILQLKSAKGKRRRDIHFCLIKLRDLGVLNIRTVCKKTATATASVTELGQSLYDIHHKRPMVSGRKLNRNFR